MAFDPIESSNDDGQPIALYTIAWGNDVWRYTSADRDIPRTELVDDVPTEVEYKAIAISDGGFRQGGSQQNDFTVTAPDTIEIAQYFLSTPPTGRITLTVRRVHVGDGDDEAPIYWIGQIGNIRRKGAATVEIIGRARGASNGQTGVRMSWGRRCPHFLYDGQCGVAKALFAVPVTITALTGNTITVSDPGHDQGWFDGGFFEWVATAAGTIDRRGIERSLSTTELVIFGTTDRLEVGMDITLYPGCDLLPTTCNDKFDNLPNYGGFEFLSSESPFNGDPVF